MAFRIQSKNFDLPVPCSPRIAIEDGTLTPGRAKCDATHVITKLKMAASSPQRTFFTWSLRSDQSPLMGCAAKPVQILYLRRFAADAAFTRSGSKQVPSKVARFRSRKKISAGFSWAGLSPTL